MKFMSATVLIVTAVLAYSAIFIGRYVSERPGNDWLAFGMAGVILAMSAAIGAAEIRQRNRRVG